MEERTLLDEQPTPPVEEVSELPKSEHAPEPPERRRWGRFFKIIGGIVMTLLVCFFLLAAFSIWYVNRWPKPSGELDTWDFGNNGTKGVILPFTITNGMIRIRGFIGNHPTRFLVDTGSYSSVVPKRLHLGIQYANDSDASDASGNAVWTHPVFIPITRIGKITIHNLSAHVADRYKTSERLLSGATTEECILGNSALSHIVITIDYPRHLITFQPPQSDPFPARPIEGIAYRYTWLNRDNSNGNYTPMMKGESYCHRLNVLFDTGGADFYLISPLLEARLVQSKNTSISSYKIKSQTMYGSLVTVLTKPMTVTFPCDLPKRAIPLRLYARVAPVCSDPTSAVIGGYIFRRYIVTIDYPHRTMTFRFSKAS